LLVLFLELCSGNGSSAVGKAVRYVVVALAAERF